MHPNHPGALTDSLQWPGSVLAPLDSLYTVSPEMPNYYPPLHCDHFWFLNERLVPLEYANNTNLTLRVEYSPSGLLSTQMKLQMEQTWKTQQDTYGTPERDK